MESDTVATLGDFVELVRGTTYKGALVGKPGPALLGLGAIRPGGGFRDSDFKTYGGECPPKLMLTPGDLFASLKGATKDGEMIGSVACVPTSVRSGRLTQDTVKLVFRRRDHDSERYVYWMLRTPQYRAYCAGRATGSAVVALSRDDFLAYSFPLPSADRRHCIRLLDNVEQRVALLRQTNATLESIARAMFKSWFIDFDAVRAKAEGRVPEGLDAATAALFPAELQDSELGPIPKGWTVQPIGGLVETVGGSTPDTKNEAFWQPAVHHWTSPKDLSRATAPVLLDTEWKVSGAGLAKISSGLLPVGTLLMSSRAPIGYLSLTQVPVAINQGYIAMLPGGQLSPSYLYFWCQCNMDAIEGRANGSTFMEISKKAFRPIPTVLPSPDVVAQFTGISGTMFERVTANERQARSLVALRDTLLPRLISGKLGLPEAQEQMEAAFT